MPVLHLHASRSSEEHESSDSAVLERILLFFRDLRDFLDQNGFKEVLSYLVPRQRKLTLYIVSASETYDPTLSTKVAEFLSPYLLDELIDSYSIVPKSNEEELSAFFDPNMALRSE